jgi:peptidoglycan/xylan/chitin deacetylase (PgdA/CDA1 family)
LRWSEENQRHEGSQDEAPPFRLDPQVHILDKMRRRQLLGQIGYGLSAVALGGAAIHSVDKPDMVGRTPRLRWASTVAPQAAQGAARTWWSADVAVGRQVALTFDDGPTEQFTSHVLDLLEQADIQATFFVVGALVELHPDLIRRAHEAGHEIGNHSYDHISAAVSDGSSVRDAVLRGGDAIEAVTGVRPRWFRPPRGEVTTATLNAVREAQLDLALWSVDRGPAPDPDSEGVRRHLAGALQPGAIVDMHDGIGRSAWVGPPSEGLIIRRRAEISALPQVLPVWKDDGYTFSTLSRLIP